MKRFLPLLLTGLCLSACQTIPAETPGEPIIGSYKALGTEPFWSMKIENGMISFDHLGEVAAKPQSYTARPSFNGWRYVSKEITADVTFEECSDGMSDFTYKDTVIVMVGDRKYEGCGGGVVVPKSLEGTRWRFVSIDGARLASERDAGLLFEKGRLSGGVGCNLMGADYSFGNQKLSVGPVMSTKMGCPDAVNAQEQAFAGVLATLASTEFPGDGSMVLTGSDGAKVVLEQVI
jgi:heat shock protein HslJ